MSDFGAPTNGAAAENTATPGPDAREELKKQELAQNLALLREKGWNNPIPFNYEIVGSGAMPNDERKGDESWLGNAAVYEWDDEYGEVGPKNEHLELQLYHGEEIMRAGNRILALSFEVDAKGGDGRVLPVREVFSPLVIINVPWLIFTTVCGCRFTPCHAGERTALPIQGPNSYPVILHSCRSNRP